MCPSACERIYTQSRRLSTGILLRFETTGTLAKLGIDLPAWLPPRSIVVHPVWMPRPRLTALNNHFFPQLLAVQPQSTSAEP